MNDLKEKHFNGEKRIEIVSGAVLLSTVVYFAVLRLFRKSEDKWFYIYIGSFAVFMIGVIDRMSYDFLIMHDEVPLQYEILWFFSWNGFLDGSIKVKFIGVDQNYLIM